MVYINRYGQCQRETVDEFVTREEALRMLREYVMSDPSARYWLSSRRCRGWKE